MSKIIEMFREELENTPEVVIEKFLTRVNTRYWVDLSNIDSVMSFLKLHYENIVLEFSYVSEEIFYLDLLNSLKKMNGSELENYELIRDRLKNPYKYYPTRKFNNLSVVELQTRIKKAVEEQKALELAFEKDKEENPYTYNLENDPSLDFNYENIEVKSLTKNGDNAIAFVYFSSEYDYPEVSFKTMKQVSKFLGCKEIDIVDVNCVSCGCDTCGHGSKYELYLKCFDFEIIP